MATYEPIDASAVHPRKRVCRVLTVVALIAAVVVVVVVASKSSVSGEQPSSSSTNACPLTHTSTMQRHALRSGREFMIYVPTVIQYPAAAIFAWHGLTENPKTMEDRAQLFPLAEQLGFLAVYPLAQNEGFAAAFNGAGCCKNDPNFLDVEYAQDVVSDLASQECLTVSRVFSMGFSNGGFMTHRAACENSELFAAACPHSGLIGDYSGDLSKSPWTKCDASGPRKVPIMGFHGTTDRLVPVGGGRNPGSGAAWFSFNDTMAIWERRHGCSDPITEQLVGSDGRRYFKRAFKNCPVSSYTVVQLAHEWWADATTTCVALFRQFGL